MSKLTNVGSNYVNKIANMLGVEVGEEFKIIAEGYEVKGGKLFHFDEHDGLVDGDHSTRHSYPDALYNLILGEYAIRKVSWKPKQSEVVYYYDALCGEVVETMFDIGSSAMLIMYKNGMIHRTKKEAELFAKLDEHKLELIRKELQK